MRIVWRCGRTLTRNPAPAAVFMGDRIHPKHRPAMNLVSFLEFAVQLFVAICEWADPR